MLHLRLLNPSTPEGALGSTRQPAAILQSLHGDKAQLSTNRSLPPGAPVALEWQSSSDSVVFEARTRGCRRDPSEQQGFVLEVRLVNLSKQARATLETLTSRAARPDSNPATGH